jgi:hypothetical protein
VRRSRVFRLSWPLRFLMQQQHPKCEQAIHLMYPPLPCNLRSSFKLANENLTEIGPKIQTAVSRLTFRIRHMFIWPFFLTMTDTITSQNIDPYSWIILYSGAFPVQSALWWHLHTASPVLFSDDGTKISFTVTSVETLCVNKKLHYCMNDDMSETS